MAKFSLDKVYLYRKNIEFNKAQELARIERARILYQEKVEEFQAEIFRSQNKLQEWLQKGGQISPWLKMQENFERSLAEKIQFLQIKIQQMEQAAVAKRKELQKANIDCRTIANLKERFLIEEKEKQEKQERNFFNELSLQRFHFQKNSSSP